MAEQSDRDRLAAALITEGIYWGGDDPGITDRLMVTVRAMQAEAAAAALEQARWAVHVERFNDEEDPDARWPKGAPRAAPTFYGGMVRAEAILRDRAAALRQQAQT